MSEPNINVLLQFNNLRVDQGKKPYIRVNIRELEYCDHDMSC